MKKALTDTLVAIFVMLVLAITCIFICRYLYFKYYYAKYTDEEIENLTSSDSRKDVELPSMFKDNPMKDNRKPAAWNSIDEDV